MLIQQPKALEADDLVKRTDHKEGPAARRRRARPALAPLCTWGTENMEEVTRVFARREALDRRDG